MDDGKAMERVMGRMKKDEGGKKRRGRREGRRGIYMLAWPTEINREGVTQARKNPNRAVTQRSPDWEGTCQTGHCQVRLARHSSFIPGSRFLLQPLNIWDNGV
jgi:hypothetical protein